ncbi:hypothetical protein ACHAXN_006863 [Cyclotella atomus]
MKFSTAIIAILISSPCATSLNINPHQRRYNDVVINTALSSTAFDTRAPPVSISENYNRGLDVDFISSALLEPPMRENGYYNDMEQDDADEYPENYEFEQMSERQMKQPQQKFRQNVSQPRRYGQQQQYISQQFSQQAHTHRVMTGAERRSTWESYAKPGLPGRHINSNAGGVMGSLNGIGGWQYTSMYGPATSVNSFDRPRRNEPAYGSNNSVHNGGRANIRSGAQTSNSAASYNMGNVIGLGPQRPSIRESSHHVGGAVMTGAQRRAGFQNIHSYEPFMPQGATYHQLPDSLEFESSHSYDHEEAEILDSNEFGATEAAQEQHAMPFQQLDVTSDQAASFNGFKPAPALEVDERNQVDNSFAKSAPAPSKFSPLPKQAAPFKGASGPQAPINGMGSAMLKGPGSIGLKGKEQSKGPFAKSNISSFKSGSTTPLNDSKMKIPSFNGTDGPTSPGSMLKNTGALEITGNVPSKGVFGGALKFPGGSFSKPDSNSSPVKSPGVPSIKSSSSTPFPINGSGVSFTYGLKQGPGGIGLKGKEQSKGGVFGAGIKSQGSNPFAKAPFKTAGTTSFNAQSPSSLVTGVKKSVDNVELKGNVLSNGISSPAPGTPPLKGSGGPLSGLFGKGKSSFKSAGGTGKMPSKSSFAATSIPQGGTSSPPTKFKPFVPTPEQDQPDNVANVQKELSFNGFKQPAATITSADNSVGLAGVGQNKFKPFVPSFKPQEDIRANEPAPPKQDLAAFLQNPIKVKKDAKTVAASLSALSSPPVFYNDFESTEMAGPSNENQSNDLNFVISNGVVQDMPSSTGVPMNTPARQSLPPYLSLHPIPGKGLGVITNKAFKIGEFIGNYEGEIMSEEVKDRRYLKSLEHKLTDEDRQWIESRLDRGQTITGTYLYGVDLDVGNAYKHFGRKREEEEEPAPDRIFVDAEDEYESLWTRFINHASPPLDNLKPMSVPESYDGKPRVWFMAKRDIEPGEELCFDYGEDYWLEGDEVY